MWSQDAGAPGLTAAVLQVRCRDGFRACTSAVDLLLEHVPYARSLTLQVLPGLPGGVGTQQVKIAVKVFEKSYREEASAVC